MTFFDPSQESTELSNYSVPAPGEYHACITAQELKDDQYGNEFIGLELTLVKEGKKYRDNIYLTHPQYDDMAQKGRARLALYTTIAGTGKLQSPADLRKLIGKEYVVTFENYIQKSTGNTKCSIVGIREYHEYGGNSDVIEDDDVPYEPAPPKATAKPTAMAPRAMARVVR